MVDSIRDPSEQSGVSLVDLWWKICINYEQIRELVCGPSHCKLAKRKGGPWWALKKKAWMAIAQNRLPFGFHIHIIDLWIFYTVFTTPLWRLYLHIWSTFQFALHEHKSPPGIMKFHFKKVFFCLFCLNVCTFYYAPSSCVAFKENISHFYFKYNSFCIASTCINICWKP